MLRTSTIKRRHKNAPRIAEKSAPGFLQWLRGCVCHVEWAGGCEGKIEAAHTYGAGDKGMATKTADKHAIPLCSKHHAEQHRNGWKSFEAKHGFDAPKTDARYWQAWPGRRAWEEKLEAGR